MTGIRRDARNRSRKPGVSTVSRTRGRAAVATRTRRDLAAVPGLDAIRWSRVMTAQARIAVGYYERADVQDLVVSAVLSELKGR